MGRRKNTEIRNYVSFLLVSHSDTRYNYCCALVPPSPHLSSVLFVSPSITFKKQYFSRPKITARSLLGANRELRVIIAARLIEARRKNAFISLVIGLAADERWCGDGMGQSVDGTNGPRELSGDKSLDGTERVMLDNHHTAARPGRRARGIIILRLSRSSCSNKLAFSTLNQLIMPCPAGPCVFVITNGQWCKSNNALIMEDDRMEEAKRNERKKSFS